MTCAWPDLRTYLRERLGRGPMHVYTAAHEAWNAGFRLGDGTVPGNYGPVRQELHALVKDGAADHWPDLDLFTISAKTPIEKTTERG